MKWQHWRHGASLCPFYPSKSSGPGVQSVLNKYLFTTDWRDGLWWKIIVLPGTIETTEVNSSNKWSLAALLWAVFPSFLRTHSLSLRHCPLKCVAHGLSPSKPVCDGHLKLWLQDTWVLWTEYLSTPLLKYVKDYIIIHLEMKILRLIPEATAKWGQIDSIQ